MIYVNKSLSPQVPAQLREFGPMGTCGLVIHLVLPSRKTTAGRPFYVLSNNTV